MKKSLSLEIAEAIEPAVCWYTRRFPHRGTGWMLKRLYDFDACDHTQAVRVPFLKKHTLEVDRSTYMGWYLYFYGVYDPGTLSQVRDLLPRGGVAVDVGAGVGDYTVAMAEAVGAGGAVHSFEPSPGEFARLARNVALNGLSQVRTYQAAVAEATGTGVFDCFAGANTSRGTLLTASSEVSTTSVGCQVAAIDDLATEWPRLDLMKIDAQGADLQVLVGARRALERHRPVIIINAAVEALYQRFGGSIRELEALLRDARYRLDWITAPTPTRKGVGIARPI